jgi:hypothetical protein
LFNKFKELKEDEEDQLEKNIVWIFADRRSGTTWLGLELLSHNTKAIDEPLVGFHLAVVTELQAGTKTTLETHSFRPDYFFSKEYEVIWKKYFRKLILNRIYAQVKDLNRKIIIKEPTGSFAADVLADLLPGSKVILLLRDGRDVLDSKLDARKPGGWGTQGKIGLKELTDEQRLAWLKTRAKQWVKLMEILLKTAKEHPKDKLIKIQYEKLLSDTFSELRKLYDFLSIEISDDEINQIVEKYSFQKIPEYEKGEGKFRRFATPGKWQENFSEREIQALNRIMGDTLKRLDYLE